MSKKKTNRGLLALAALAALLLALGLAACGGGGDDSSSSSATEAESTEAAAGGGEEKERVSVAMEEILTGVAFGQEIKQGIEGFAAEDGNVDVEVQGPPSTEPEVAQKQASDMLAKQPDAFGFAPFPPELWTRTAQNIWDQVGPNVLTFNERPSSEPQDVSSSPVQTFVGTDDKGEAREMLEETIKLAKLKPSETGEVILGQCVAQEAGVLAQRTEGFEEALASLLPKAKVEKFTSEVEPQANTEAWTTELAAHPSPVLATGTCDQDGTSLYKVKKEKGYDMIVGAMELPPETIAGLKDGSIIAAMGTNWWLQGYTATRMLAEAARGAELPEGFVNTGQQLFTKADVAAVEERAKEPAKFYAAGIEELFGGGMPTAVPIEEAWK
ncbi:MAG: sugar ABC transporter substrate-binding protein [Solirubrobacterales bacterium]